MQGGSLDFCADRGALQRATQTHLRFLVELGTSGTTRVLTHAIGGNVRRRGMCGKQGTRESKDEKGAQERSFKRRARVFGGVAGATWEVTSGFALGSRLVQWTRQAVRYVLDMIP